MSTRTDLQALPTIGLAWVWQHISRRKTTVAASGSAFQLPPPLWAYQTCADVTGIVGARPHLEPFLLNHYILLTAPRTMVDGSIPTGMALSVWPTITPQHCAKFGLFKLHAMQPEILTSSRLRDELQSVFKEGKITYCRAICDKFFIPGSPFFLQRHIPHPILLVGVDSFGDNMICHTFKRDGQYGRILVPFALFQRAICSKYAAPKAMAWKQDVLYRLTLNEHYECPINIIQIQDQVLDFLASSTTHTRRWFLQLQEPAAAAGQAFGMEAVKVLEKHFIACEKNQGIPDLRCTRMLMEHAILMHHRVRKLYALSVCEHSAINDSIALAQATKKLHFAAVEAEHAGRAEYQRAMQTCVALFPVIELKYTQLLSDLAEISRKA